MVEEEYVLGIRSIDTEIGIVTDSKQAKEYLENNREIEENVPEVEYGHPEDPEFMVEYFSEREPELDFWPDRGKIILEGKYGEEVRKNDLPRLIIPAFARLHNQKDRNLYGAGSVKGESSALIIGEKKEEELQLVRNLCESGTRYISGKKSLLNSDSEIIGKTRNREGYRTAEVPSEIDRIYFIDIKPDSKLETDVKNESESIDRLLEETDRTIRTTGTTVMNSRKPLPSFDSQRLSEKRLENTIQTVRNTDIMDFQGSLEDVTRYIRQEMA